MAEPRGALDEVLVIELGEWVSAPFATRLMADMGADVVKIERAGRGDPARDVPPFATEGDRDTGALYCYLNAGKRSVTMDVDDTAGQRILLRMLESADVFVTDLPARALRARGLDPAAVLPRCPHLIFASVTPYGLSGPYADLPACDLTACALGGQMHPTGMPNREPLRPAGFQADYLAGLHAFGATVAALYDAKICEVGGLVEIAAVEAMAASAHSRGQASAAQAAGRSGETPATGEVPVPDLARVVDGPGGETLRFPGPPLRMSVTPLEPGRPPRLGEHTEAVLVDDFGMPPSELSRLREAGVL